MTQDTATMFAEATQRHEAGQWQDAERLYRSVLAADPRHADALHQFGVLAYQNGNHDVAVDLVKRAIDQAPANATYYNTLGGALLAIGCVAEAVAAFESALRISPDSIETRNNLANALQTQGKLDEAISIFRSILETVPNDADVQNNLGHALQIRGEFDEAIHHFRIAREARPNDALILSHLGNALCSRGVYKEAVEVCEQATALSPDSPIAHTNLGNALLKLARLDEAVQAYRQAVAIANDIPDIHKNLGIAYHMLGRWDEASACFAKALELNPNEDIHAALGESYYARGKLEEAVQAFRQALDLKPDDYTTRYALGAALNDLGRHTEGLAAMAAGPGLVRLSSTSTHKSLDAGDRRISLSGGEPNFIGCWTMQDPSLCQGIIDFFESRTAEHMQGRTSLGVNLDIKNATDLPIFPKDLEQPGYEAVAAYIRELEVCLWDYGRQWPFFAQMLTSVDIVPFKIQRYTVGEHFQKLHAERVSFGLMHRVLAWMTYLNDVESGGETKFPHYGLEIIPQLGKTLIWPAEWTHAHAGSIVKAGTKYIITGWMHFPHPSAPETPHP